MPPKAAGRAKAKGKAKAEAAPKDAAAGKDKDGAPTLRGAAVVFTGELDMMTRVEAEDKVKAMGGKVMGSVSGNTDFLVLGSHLDDGRAVEETSKYRKYLALKEKGGKCPALLRENDLSALLGGPPGGAAAEPAARPVVVERTFSTAVERTETWVDRHAPKNLDELLGNASSVKKLSTWLKDWDDVVLRGRKKPVPFKPGGGMPDNVNARAALLSGPPGIGKSTAARLVAKALGWAQVLEYNASDARSKKIIDSMAEGLSDNRTLSFGGGARAGLNAATAPLTGRCVIIMDEVDGMGGGDRGGNAALIKMIKRTKNPIICICNDHGSPKVRSLAFSCFDIRFSRPTKSTISKRVAEIAATEGLAAEPNALEALAESCGSDIRHVLNQLQMMASMPEYKQSEIMYTEMKDRLRGIEKDGAIMLNPFDACKHLLTSSVVQKMSMREKLDHFFVDFNLVHLMVQENYLEAVAKKPVDDGLLEKCAAAAESIAHGDIIGDAIRGRQEWSLLPDYGLASAVYPASLVNGFVAFPQFPKFLGNYSKNSRARRLCSELQVHLRLSSNISTRDMVSSGYLQRLYGQVMEPLEDEDVGAATAVLDAYGLQRDHVAEHMSELMVHLGRDDRFKLVDPKVKAAMTRELNSGSHALRVVLPPTKKKRGGNAPPEGEDLGEVDAEPKDKAEGAAEDAEEGAKEEDEVVVGGLIRRSKPKKAAKEAGTAKAKARVAAASARIAGREAAATAAAAKAAQKGTSQGAKRSADGAAAGEKAKAKATAKAASSPGGAPPRADPKAAGKAKAQGRAAPKATPEFSPPKTRSQAKASQAKVAPAPPAKRAKK